MFFKGLAVTDFWWAEMGTQDKFVYSKSRQLTLFEEQDDGTLKQYIHKE